MTGSGVDGGDVDVEPDRTLFVPVDAEVDLHVREWDGDGRPVVLVHGLASNARMWDGVAVALAGHGHRVLAVDQRGHGRSAKPEAGFDMDRVVTDLVALLDAADVVAPVVAGQSWGGNVVVELAATHPGRAAAVVGVDGGTIRLRDRFPDWDEAARTLRPPPLVGRPRAEIEAMFRSMHPDWPETGIRGAMACYEVRADDTIAPWLDLDRHLAVLAGLWHHDPFASMRRIADPTAFVTAGPDPASDAGQRRLADDEWYAAKVAGMAEATRRLDHVPSAGDRPGVQVTWIDGDHDLHAQHPNAVADLLRDLSDQLP